MPPRKMSRRAPRRASKRYTLSRPVLYNYGKTTSSTSMFLGGSELKHYDLTLASGGVTTSGYTTDITSNIAAGSGVTQRVGNQVLLKRIRIEIFAIAGDATNFCKFFLLACPNGQVGGPSFTTWTDYPDDDQFIMLKQRCASVSTSEPKSFVITHTFPGKGLQVRWDTTTGASTICNKILFTMVSDSSAAPHPTVSGLIRVEYIDP